MAPAASPGVSGAGGVASAWGESTASAWGASTAPAWGASTASAWGASTASAMGGATAPHASSACNGAGYGDASARGDICQPNCNMKNTAADISKNPSNSNIAAVFCVGCGAFGLGCERMFFSVIKFCQMPPQPRLPLCFKCVPSDERKSRNDEHKYHKQKQTTGNTAKRKPRKGHNTQSSAGDAAADSPYSALVSRAVRSSRSLSVMVLGKTMRTKTSRAPRSSRPTMENPCPGKRMTSPGWVPGGISTTTRS